MAQERTSGTGEPIDGPFVLGCSVMVDAVKPLNPPVLDHATPT